MKVEKEIDEATHEHLLRTLKGRFEQNMNRHAGLRWADVEKKFVGNYDKLWSLAEMERTEGEPDVIGFDEAAQEFLICDCAAESPKGRRSLCYDQAAQRARKEFVPENNAVDMATVMGIELLNEAQYRKFQQQGNYDMKTSSWIKTPEDIRNLGGALFADRRYGHVFVYHNGASSYYSVRGFRGILRI
jgi:hypothetical protein